MRLGKAFRHIWYCVVREIVILFLADIKFRVKCVEVFGIEMFFYDIQPFAEMSDLRKWLEPFICKGFSRFLKFDIMLC